MPPSQSETKPKPRAKWTAPHIKLEWGSYFRADPEEQAKIVSMCSEALAGNLAPLRSVVAKLAPIFEFDNIDEIVEQIEEQQEAADERELGKMTAEAETLHKLAGDAGGAKPGGGAGGAGNAPKNAGGGSRGASASAKKSKKPAP